MALKGGRPFLLSSRILSLIRIFASTAIPIVRMRPAMPGKVNVAPNSVSAPNTNAMLILRAKLAIAPQRPYIATINASTNKAPATPLSMPVLIASLPKSGPTVRSSIMLNGTGNAPVRNISATSWASGSVKDPAISPRPPGIGPLITGAVITSSSSTIASTRPTLSRVMVANCFAPILSNLKVTTGWPV